MLGRSKVIFGASIHLRQEKKKRKEKKREGEVRVLARYHIKSLDMKLCAAVILALIVRVKGTHDVLFVCLYRDSLNANPHP